MEQKHSQQNQREVLENLIKDYYEKMMKYRPDASYDSYEKTQMADEESVAVSMEKEMDIDALFGIDNFDISQEVIEPVEKADVEMVSRNVDYSKSSELEIKEMTENLPEFFEDWDEEYSPVKLSGKSMPSDSGTPVPLPGKSKLSELVTIEWLEDLANEFAKSLYHLRIATIDEILNSLHKADPMLRKMVEERLREMMNK